MKEYEPGKQVAPVESLDAASSGKIKSDFATAGYRAGKIPVASLFSAVPFGPEASEFMAWLYCRNGVTLYQEMHDTAGYNVKVLPCTIIAPETSGWFAEEITSAAQLDGLKMRFFGLGGKVIQKLGVATSLLPGGEICPALEKGAIDATEFSMPAIDQRLGFDKLLKFNYFPGWHQQATVFELLINKDEWDALAAELQAQIELTSKAQMTESNAGVPCHAQAKFRAGIAMVIVRRECAAKSFRRARENRCDLSRSSCSCHGAGARSPCNSAKTADEGPWSTSCVRDRVSGGSTTRAIRMW